MAGEPILMTIRDLAKLLGISERAIWEWSSDGKFPAPLELGRLRRWRREDINKWLASKSAGAKA